MEADRKTIRSLPFFKNAGSTTRNRKFTMHNAVHIKEILTNPYYTNLSKSKNLIATWGYFVAAYLKLSHDIIFL